MITHQHHPKFRMADGKRRPLRVIRESLAEVAVRIRRLDRNAKILRGALRRSKDPQEQLLINRQLEGVARSRAIVKTYVEGLKTPAWDMPPTIPSQPESVAA